MENFANPRSDFPWPRVSRDVYKRQVADGARVAVMVPQTLLYVRLVHTPPPLSQQVVEPLPSEMPHMVRVRRDEPVDAGIRLEIIPLGDDSPVGLQREVFSWVGLVDYPAVRGGAHT